MRTITHTEPGVAVLDLSIGVAVVEVVAEDREYAEITLAPAVSVDSIAADLIRSATVRHTARQLEVAVPAPVGTVVSGGAVIVGGTVHGGVSFTRASGSIVVGSMSGVTVAGGGLVVVNGQVITGGATVVGSGGGVRVTARLPVGSSLVVSSDSPATVITHGSLDTVELRTESGDLTVDSAREIEARTASGDIRIQVGHHVIAHSMSGDIRVGALTGPARLRSMSGDLTVHAIQDTAVQAHTMSGDVRISSDPGVVVSSEARSMSGRVINRTR
ncbi:hypothetical protein JOF56_011000 [Kibdelosporangium banguiense]|uniref:DUF4097 domain-containing protein n=1 Tax=Kibdelosporangium banguiense TaxID=1365924 RepID=A0ABS4U1W0_9PSEU|nr:DUF4097 family beta strand repeat-containing protein [Kibdelosporangium banguiense]MBP2330615.1 hypothetical protein [Kibdelosporangium banguiense]